MANNADFDPSTLLDQNPRFVAWLETHHPDIKQNADFAYRHALAKGYKHIADAVERDTRLAEQLSDKNNKRKRMGDIDDKSRVDQVKAVSDYQRQKQVPLAEQIDQPGSDNVCSGITAHGQRCLETRSLKSVPGLIHPYNSDRELKLCNIRHFKEAESQKKKILACLKAGHEYHEELLNANLDAMQGAGQAIINSVNARAVPPKAPTAPKVQQRSGVALSTATKKPVAKAPATTVAKPPAKPVPKPAPKSVSQRVAQAPNLTVDVMQIDMPAPAPKVMAPPVDKMLIDTSDADDGEDDDDDDDEVAPTPTVVLTQSNDLLQKVNNMTL